MISSAVGEYRNLLYILSSMHHSLLSLGKLTLEYTTINCEHIREAYALFGGIKRHCRSYILRSEEAINPEVVKITKALDGISPATGPMPFNNNMTQLVNIELLMDLAGVMQLYH